MNRRLALWTFVVVAIVGASRFAHAQGAGQGEVTIGYQGLPYKAPGETQNGIQVSDGVLLHVGAGAEGGYDSNVFYTDTAPTGAAIYRATLFGELTNATRTGLTRSLSFDARAGLQYRRYQFIDDIPANTPDYKNAWMPTAGLALNSGSGQFGFGIADTFARVEDPPYNVGGQIIIRNNNQASIEGRWSPGGGRLSTMLRYINMVDIFDQSSGYSYANSVTNVLMLDASWKWLPKTAIFVNAQQGYVFYLSDNPNGKESAFPLRVAAGLRGLLTERTSAVLSLGYNNAFVTGGAASTSGFWGSSFAELSFTLRPSDLSRVVAGYRHDFQNSVISQFYNSDTVYLSYVQQIAGRLALDLSGRYVRKDYVGLLSNAGATSRVDNFFQVGATLDYFVRNWMYAGVGYALLVNNANQTVTPGADPNSADYTKQQMFVRLGLTY